MAMLCHSIPISDSYKNNVIQPDTSHNAAVLDSVNSKKVTNIETTGCTWTTSKMKKNKPHSKKASLTSIMRILEELEQLAI